MATQDAEAVNNTLLEVGLPSSIADMKNPTEDYILNLTTQFMHKYFIDLSTIRKPTFEQLSTLSLAEENPEILTLVNISEAMAGICNLILFKDFNIADVTSPVSSRTRKIARFLANFVLYANNKTTEIEEQLEETRVKVQEINSLREKKNVLVEIKNAKALEVTKKLATKEQILKEIEQIKVRKEERKSKIVELEMKLEAVEKKKMKAAQHHGRLTTEAIKMRKATQELESRIVKSPKRYEASLQEVMEQKKVQIERRELMQEKIRCKKPAIEKIESYLSFVRQEHEKFPELTEAYKHLTESKKVMEEAKKKVTEMKSVIEQEIVMYNQDNEQASNSAFEKAQEQCEHSLSSIRKEHNELLNEKKVLEMKLEDTMSRQQEILSQMDNIRAATKQRDNGYKVFMKNCQELYDAEMKKEREYRDLWNSVETNVRE